LCIRFLGSAQSAQELDSLFESLLERLFERLFERLRERLFERLRERRCESPPEMLTRVNGSKVAI